jgi:NAD(P)-dependent dehydrogenase (short-subunit alcohol dehydrogenase family)
MNILVTGANRGLGIEITKISSENGHLVVAGVRDPDRPNDELAKLVKISIKYVFAAA